MPCNFVVFQGRKKNLVNWSIFQIAIYFQNSRLLLRHYDVIIGVFWKGHVTLPFLKEEAQNFVSCIILMCFPRKRN